MKLSKIMLGVAALALGGAVVAAPLNTRIAYSAGASATKGNLKIALTSMCTAAGGTLHEFVSGNNVSTHVCSTVGALTGGAAGTYATTPDASFRNFAGTNFAELRLNVAGGSFTATRGANDIFVDDLGADLLFFDPILNAGRSKGQLIADRPGTVYVGGIMDVQPQTWPSSVIAGLTIPVVTGVAIQQAFGVAVSVPLYTEMFNSQKSAGSATIDKPIPSTCLVTDTAKVECVPTISKGQMAAIMSNNDTNGAYSNGANFLASTLASGTELRYIRRVDTSGTQAAAQNYFLGLPCAGVSLSVVDEPTSDDEIDTVSVPGFNPPVVNLKDALINSIRVVSAGGTGNVRQELSKSTIEGGAQNYAIGVMSGENNQSSGNLFRWLRVQGAAMSENAAPNNGQTNRAAVINGSYDFYYESVVVTPTSGAGVLSSFWGPVSNTLKNLQATGLVKAADQLFTKGGNTCQLNSAN